MDEIRWYGERLSPELQDVKIIVLSDLHYGNPYCSVKHFLRAVDFIKRNENCYCFLNGDLMEAALKTSNGDVYVQKLSPKQQRIDITEMLKPIKNNILGMTCLTDDTLVLTDSGWKTCYEIAITDKVLSMNLQTDLSGYSSISGVFIKPWSGDIINLGSTRQSQRLTPDHWVLYKNSYTQRYEYRQVEALPEDMHHIAMPIARIYCGGKQSFSNDEIMFLAWVITEGHICAKRSLNPVIEITQSKDGLYNKELADLFLRLGLNPSIHNHKGRKDRVDESDWMVYYFPFEQVKKYIEILSRNKEIPRLLLDSPYLQLKLLYETMLKGDGNLGRKEYYTANKYLALQVMELCLKLGYGARLLTRKRKQLYAGYKKPVSTIGYTIKMYRYSNAYPKNKSTVNYQGNVFCLATSMGNFMAMRNGQPFFTGNTGNHERRIADLTSDDPSELIAKELGVPYRPEGMLYKLSFGDMNNRTKGKPFVFWSYITHGYGGARTKSAKSVKVERLSNMVHADYYAQSHDHVVNVAPDIYLMPDNRGTIDKDGFLTGKVTAHREMLVKTNSFLKWGGYAELGGFPPSDLATPVIHLLTPYSKLWEGFPDRPQRAVKVSV